MGVIKRGMELYGFPRPFRNGIRLPIPLRVRTCRGGEQKDLTSEWLGHSSPERLSIYVAVKAKVEN